MRAYILLTLCCFICSNAWTQTADSTRSHPDKPYTGEIKATAFIDGKQVPQNRLATCTVEVKWNGDLDKYEIEALEPPVLTNFAIVGTSSSNWVGELDGVQHSIKKYEFILSPTELGMAYIDGVIIEYTDIVAERSRKLITNRLEIEVTDPVIERDFSTFFFAGAGLLILAFAGVISFYVVRRKKVAEAEKERMAEEAIPVEEKYLNELKSSVDLSNVDMTNSFSSISKIFKSYLSERYGLAAVEQTSREIASELQSKALSESIVEKTEEILNTCDIAKFSGGTAERTGLERIYTLVEDILTTNQSEFMNETDIS